MPPHVLHGLSKVARDLRDLPRDCIRDRQELVHWLARLARRVDAIAGSKVPIGAPVLVGVAPASPVSAKTGAAPIGSPRRLAIAAGRKLRRGKGADRRARLVAAGQLALPGLG